MSRLPEELDRVLERSALNSHVMRSPFFMRITSVFSRAERGKAISMVMQRNFNLSFMAGPRVTGPTQMATQNGCGAL